METRNANSNSIKIELLLPIREAYEWKPPSLLDHRLLHLTLASNSWSVWMETRWRWWWNRMRLQHNLLPIREAYEWKLFPKLSWESFWHLPSCFQFVKRMNGNDFSQRLIRQECVGATCFQFVKRMNGNGKSTTPQRLYCHLLLLPIREAYEWKQITCQLGIV